MMRRMIVAAAVLATLAAPVAAQQAFTIEQVAEGVYIAEVVPNPPMYVFANALIVIGDDGVLVVDTHQSPSAARALLAEVRKLTDKPVRTVVNTHWHGDHIYGNQVYREAFPGVRFIGHHTAREDALEIATKRLAEEIEQLPASIEQRKEWLRTGKGPDGRDLTEEEIAAVERSARLRTEYLTELKGLTITPPDVTFERTMRLHLGERVVELYYFGMAHTRGDIVVYLPDIKLLAAGDLLEDAFPYFGDSYPNGWAGVLQEMGSLEMDLILPAHGSLQHDRTLLTVETELLAALVEEVAEATLADKTLEEALSEITLERFREFFTKGDSNRDAAYARSVKAAVERTFKEFKLELDFH